ncbi:MAG: hypothetical protein COB15_17395 [Flavobacteriales bacterium]|nr:MAG: hypothetical protein COB15_17395 [Flavobacteriales bacterium]
MPIISSIINNEEYSINQLPDQEINIPIKILTGVSGIHAINIDNVSDFSNGNCLILEDLITGTIYDLNTDSSFTTYIYDTTTTAQFLLHIGAPIEISSTDISCSNSSDAKIIYTKNSSTPFDITWKNGLGTIIASNTNIFTDSITNITAGTYTIETTDAVCGNSIETVEITSPNPVTSYFTTVSDTFYLNNGGNISFNNMSVNATDYFWEFGDGTNSIVQSPIHNYTLAGDYLVSLRSSINPTCYADYSRLITLVGNATGIEYSPATKEINAWIANDILTIDLSNKQYDFINIRNVLGQEIYSLSNPSTAKIDVNVGSFSSGVFIITLNNNDGQEVIKVSYVK